MKFNVKIAFITHLLMVSVPAVAISSSNSAKSENNVNTTYPASFFAKYTPQNALSMVQRLPAFSFDEGSEARGFGGNAGNVLIDGVRPTSKSGGLEGALERIPASQVEYIEILRGGAGAGEAAGQTIVANVVKKQIQTSGTWGVKLLYGSNGQLQPQVETAMSVKLGDWNTLFEIKAGAEPEYRTIYRESFDANDALTSHDDEILKSLENGISFNGEGARPLGGGTLTINTALEAFKWQGDISTDTFLTSSSAITQANENQFLTEDNESAKAELGIDWVKSFAAWKLRVIALTSAFNHQYENDDTTTTLISTETSDSQYSNETLETEHIARMTFSHIGNDMFSPEFGVEIASNTLDTESSLIENGLPQTLEGADVIEEIRAELFANFTYAISSDISLEGSVTVESSEIKVSSTADKRQTFNFIKPRFSVNYTINENAALTLVAEHMVDQLDFNDFAASADAEEDRTTSGNDSLRPEQASALSAIYNWRFSDRGSVNVEAVYEYRKDVHEQIFLPSGNEGLGNAGDAKFWYIKANVSLPIDSVLENGLFDIYYTYKRSDFYDDIDNKHREIYHYKPNDLIIQFRQDVLKHNFSWGFQFKSYFEKTKYYVDEIQTNDGNDRLSSIFIETTQFFNVKTRLEIKEPHSAYFNRSRYFYENDRSGNFIGSEFTEREKAPELQLTFSGSF